MAFAKQLFITFFKRNYSSALYLTGDKAQKMFVILQPVVDFGDRLKDKSELESNIKARKASIDLNKVENLWKFYKHLEYQKIVLETTKTVVGEKLHALIKQNDPKNSEDVTQLTTHLKLVKDDLYILKRYMYGIEEDTMIQVLHLPNLLHKNTPLDKEFVAHSYLEKPTVLSNSHIEASNLIDYTNPFFYFLKNEAAYFELASVDYFSDVLLTIPFTQFNNPDFCRSIVVEGCGADFSNNTEVFTLEDIHSDECNELSRLHLTGGASLYSFMAYFARHSVQESYLPLKLFACGRKYKPVISNESSLFNVNQETAIELFIASKDDEQALQNEFDMFTKIIIQLYEGLGVHFHLVYQPAHKLLKHESLRLSIQMFSNFLQDYVEVGNCSIYNSYLSKRLLFNYSVDKEHKYPKVIAGSLLRVQPLLACMLENNGDISDLFNNVLKKYVLLK